MIRSLQLLSFTLFLGLAQLACTQSDNRPFTTVPEPNSVSIPSGITLSLNEVFYGDGDPASVILDFGNSPPATERINVALTAPDSRDVETLVLLKSDNGPIYAPDGDLIRISALSSGDSVQAADGVLSVEPGQPFYALYFPDKNDPVLAQVQADAISDIAFLSNPADPTATVNPKVAMTDDEGNPLGKPVGTLIRRGSLPVQIATEELVLWSRNESDLSDFLAETDGTVLASQVVRSTGRGNSNATMHLIHVRTPEEAAASLGIFDSYLSEPREVIASNLDVIAILAYGLQLRIDGYKVALNPRLQPHAAPEISAAERGNLTRTMQMRGPFGQPPNDCMPDSATQPCIENVPALWTFMALWDFDDERINVAVLDQGFATNADFGPPGIPLIECLMSVLQLGPPTFGAPICAPGFAQGSPTYSNTWHGTGVVHTLGGVVNNGQHAAGVAGQVAVPMLYKYDVGTYAYGIGNGIRDAVDRGASCINISAGFPCNAVTHLGDFDLCNWEGRVGFCGVVTAGTRAAVEVTCAASAWLLIIGAAICAGAQSGLFVETAICLTSLIFYQDLRGPMLEAVRYAAENGVPVVVSAGNVMDLDPVVRDIVLVADWQTERWGIIPAMAPEAIVVGSVIGDARFFDPTLRLFDNLDFFGDRVDIWAPVPSSYAAPQDVDDPASTVSVTSIAGTSGAAAYISGVVAAMQAANPDLNPATPGLTNAERRTIVEQIKTILTDDANSYTNAELISFTDPSGAQIYTNQPIRRRLVDPLAAVQAAALAYMPDFAALWYDTALNFDEIASSDANAETISFGIERTGTIVAIPQASGTIVVADIDPFEFTMPSVAQRYETTITLAYPRDYGSLVAVGSGLASASTNVSGSDQVRIYGVLANAGALISFEIAGLTPDQDNVYKLTVATPMEAIPTVNIVSPNNYDRICITRITDIPDPRLPGTDARRTIVLRLRHGLELSAEVFFPGFPSFVIPESDITWTDNGSPIGNGPNLIHQLAEGSHAISVQAYEPTFSDTVTVDGIACGANPPSALIIHSGLFSLFGNSIQVEFTGYDFSQDESYADVGVGIVGTGFDNEDGYLYGTSLRWTTDHFPNVQSEFLKTGSSLTLTPLRLYAPGHCKEFVHNIQLRATDSDGLTSEPAELEVRLVKPPSHVSFCP